MKTLSISELAELLGEDYGSFRLKIQSGLIPYAKAIKINGSTQFTYQVFREKLREYEGEEIYRKFIKQN